MSSDTFLLVFMIFISVLGMGVLYFSMMSGRRRRKRNNDNQKK